MKRAPFMKTLHCFSSVFSIATLTLLTGCHTAHDVAVTSFHVIDAPANYVRRHIDEQPPTTTTSTTTATTAYQSDVSNPGRPVASASATPRMTAVHHRETSSSLATSQTSSTNSRSTIATSQKTAAKFPVAKAVAGKPGYVYSPFDPSGGYVDVTGYTSGSKVKDPYSGKIFIVP